MEQVDLVYQVIVAPAANDRMAEHLEFLARVSEYAASKLLDELIADIDSLHSSPLRNPMFNRPHLPSGKYRYMISGKRYRIVYQVEGDIVYVDDIQDCRQDDDKNIL